MVKTNNENNKDVYLWTRFRIDSKTALVNALKFAIRGIDKLTMNTDIAKNLSKPT